MVGRDLSWFLDDADADDDGLAGGVPKSWRLGNRPNLKQMHDEACTQRVTGGAVEQRLKEEVRRTRRLAEGASATGARVHTLPDSPRDLADNGEFRYAVLGPEAAFGFGQAERGGEPIPRRDHGIGQAPRTPATWWYWRVPSRDGVAATREAIRSLLGWEDVQVQLAGHSVDLLQSERLRKRLEEARRRVPETIRAAWCIVVTLNEQGQAQAFRLPADGGPLFAQIKADERFAHQGNGGGCRGALARRPVRLVAGER